MGSECYAFKLCDGKIIAMEFDDGSIIEVPGLFYPEGMNGYAVDRAPALLMSMDEWYDHDDMLDSVEDFFCGLI